MAQITINIDGNAMVIEAKQKALETLGKLDVNVLLKLAELSSNKKAVDTLMNPPALLKPFLSQK